MKRLWIGKLATAAMLAISTATLAHAEEEGIDKARADAFDARMFAKPPGNKTYACFVRRYDAEHLSRHPGQRVGAIKLLMTAEIPPDENTTNYSFRLGVKFRHRSGDFDSSGSCGHVIAEDSAMNYGSAAASTATAAASRSPPRRTTSRRSSGWSGYGSGRTTSPTRKPRIPWSPVPTTRSSGSIAPIPANARHW